MQGSVLFLFHSLFSQKRFGDLRSNPILNVFLTMLSTEQLSSQNLLRIVCTKTLDPKIYVMIFDSLGQENQPLPELFQGQSEHHSD